MESAHLLLEQVILLCLFVVLCLSLSLGLAVSLSPSLSLHRNKKLLRMAGVVQHLRVLAGHLTLHHTDTDTCTQEQGIAPEIQAVPAPDPSPRGAAPVVSFLAP